MELWMFCRVLPAAAAAAAAAADVCCCYSQNFWEAIWDGTLDVLPRVAWCRCSNNSSGSRSVLLL
jgi:hypothetical protein